jgi:hypothetical protein
VTTEAASEQQPASHAKKSKKIGHLLDIWANTGDVSWKKRCADGTRCSSVASALFCPWRFAATFLVFL